MLNEGQPQRVHGINKFADLTPEEFAARFAMPKDTLAAQITAFAESLVLEYDYSTEPPAEFDWRYTGTPIVTPVKNQEACGRCVAIPIAQRTNSYP